MSDKKRYALDAARRGLPVFPQEGKRPSIRRWPENATLKESVITRWWTRWPDADIGIALQRDIYVLDSDSPPAVAWMRSGALPPTLTVQTAKGFHAYFRVPHQLARKTPLPAATGFAAVEGKGAPGPVTWAGSVHPSGHVYSIVDDVPIAWMPGDLVWAIGPKRSQTNAGEATPAEREEWARMYHVNEAHCATRAPMAVDMRQDAVADLRLTLRALQSDLPHMPTGWADRFFRAAAYLGPHVASGGLGLDETIEELTKLFHACNEEGGPADHVTRSIARGLAVGARGSQL